MKLPLSLQSTIKKGLIKLKKDIKAKDGKNNIIEANNAEYYEKKKTLKSFGNTKIITRKLYCRKSRYHL